MSLITFDEFDLGLDLRKASSVSDANRLRRLDNAYVTTGKSIRKRPGMVKVATLEAGTKGLAAGNGKLNTFYTSGTITHANALFTANKLTKASGNTTLKSIPFVDVFNGFLYVAAIYADDSCRHHYVDGTATNEVADVKCPHSPIVAKKASKIWSSGGDVVRFTKTSTPRDWTTANDAGFLPVGLNQAGTKTVTALGEYNAQLVVFFSDSAQVWNVDPDPLKNSFAQGIDIGVRHPYTHDNMAGDVIFLSAQGIRSTALQAQTQNLIDIDVGSPIDKVVFSELPVGITPRGIYWRGGGQYWLYAGNVAWVYSFSRTAKISAWSKYILTYPIDDLTELDNVLYIRSGDDVYRMDAAAYTDNGNVFSVDIETQFLDFKLPGVLKQILAMDAAFTGTGSVAHRYDPRDPSLITSPPVPITGDTRAGRTLPVELITPNISIVINNKDASEFEVSLLSYLFENLGVW
ncbi:hypothetical protein [Chitinibacter tainanensis]|uniref:hypothetical protein n=1 Tax=Chitinibacter tainanensis TaxID=230667 RepID=UPI002353B415|nr:hypothetical protein [Chitinibacter tainanensis]